MTVWRNQNTRPISICNSYRYTLLFSMYACRWKDVHGKFPTSDDVDALFRDFVPMQLACLRQYSELLPGCADAIKRMKEDLKLKIGSSTGTVHTEIGACSKQYRCISNVHSKMPHINYIGTTQHIGYILTLTCRLHQGDGGHPAGRGQEARLHS